MRQARSRRAVERHEVACAVVVRPPGHGVPIYTRISVGDFCTIYTLSDKLVKLRRTCCCRGFGATQTRIPATAASLLLAFAAWYGHGRDTITAERPIGPNTFRATTGSSLRAISICSDLVARRFCAQSSPHCSTVVTEQDTIATIPRVARCNVSAMILSAASRTVDHASAGSLAAVRPSVNLGRAELRPRRPGCVIGCA